MRAERRFRAEGSLMEELLETGAGTLDRHDLDSILGADADLRTARAVRDDLRRQIARLEGRLAELFASAFPRRGIEWRVGAVGGPRVLEVGELERVRDALALRVSEAQVELARRGEIEERNRGLLEEMIAAPERHRWLRIAAADIGEPSCATWESRPRWGPLGILMNWWRVKISSGCPLAGGRGGPCKPSPSSPPDGA
jgi:hypothetical protein